MRILVRAKETLFQEARRDLGRPHAFAFERVGWLAAKPAMSGDTLILVGHGYYPVADDHYVRDPSVGAQINQDAMTAALNVALRDKVGMFHIHEHGGAGTPIFSPTDVREQPKMVTDFRTVMRGIPHGALVLSRDGIAGRVWLGGGVIHWVDELHLVGTTSHAFFPSIRGRG